MDILLIEDNQELAILIKAFLEREGFSLWCEASGEQGLDWLKTHKVKMVLLDIMLPGIDGFAVCQAIRRQENLPIMILSARTMKSDQLMGFELGADDYVEKPIDTDLLCAKIKALLKRHSQIDMQNQLFISGAIRADLEGHKIYLQDQLLELNGKEFDLLMLFIQNAGKTLHKEFLFNEIWGMDSESEYQTLTVHIKMLRTKIEADPKQPKRIITVWGIGYRYEEV